MMKNRWKLLMPVLMLLTGCIGKSSRDIPAVTGFEAARYMGKWHEYARLPNWFERGMRDVTAEYTAGSDNTFTVKNCGVKNGNIRTVTGMARFAGSKDKGELEVSFFPPFFSGYRIIKLAPDYRYAAVCGDDREHLWILSREKQISPADHREIISFLEEKGFPVEKLIYP